MSKFASAILVSAWLVAITACGGRPSGAKGDRAGVEHPDSAASSTDTYHSEHDPTAVYTRENINFTGSYLKVDMSDLTSDQFNRVVHRTMTEKSTCGSGLTIDECLVNRPWCWVAVELLKQVVREEVIRGPGPDQPPAGRG